MLMFENICTKDIKKNVSSASLDSPHVATCPQNINIVSLRYLLTALPCLSFFITSLVILSVHERAFKMRPATESSYTITS